MLEYGPGGGDDERHRIPEAVEDPSQVGSYPARRTRVAGTSGSAAVGISSRCHPDRGAIDRYDGDDYYYAFETYAEALAFSRTTDGAESPLALIRQDEYIDEPEVGQFVHVREVRFTEWMVEHLRHPRRNPNTIPDFIRSHTPPDRLERLRRELN